MKYVVILTVLMCGNCFAALPAFHMLAGYELNNYTCDVLKSDKWVSAPLTGIASHIIADRFIGESGIDYMVDISVVRALIMWMATPDSKKDLFLWTSFWSLFPDLVDKGLNTRYFHFYGNNHIIPFSPGLTNLGEDFSILILEVKWQ